ncbi:hypothetical protein F5884DRAFT_857122 [Xylogone sp. PMI_703]|nr:hypothetical protein F5884DRAFT_857122 [Xylogone sp. PMI_703]
MAQFTKYLLSTALFCQAVTASLFQDIQGRDLSARHYPSLIAVTVRSNIQKREDNFVPKIRSEHHYADRSSLLRGTPSRYASTSMAYKLPALTLEDIETYVTDIQCSATSIIITFPTRDMLESSKEIWDRTPQFFAISSHLSCNNDGERAVHMVSNIIYDSDASTAVFSTKKVKWDDSYDSMTVKFGTGRGKFRADALRLHDSLRRRQVATSTGLVATATSNSTAPSATPTSNSTAFDIGFSAPPDFQVFSLSAGNDAVSESLTVSCTTCSVGGAIEITEGEFTISNSTTAAFKALDFIDNGFFKVVTTGMNAQIALDTALSLSSTKSFDKTLVTITPPGFSIPGIATVGPAFTPHLIGSLQIEGSLDFTYGFDVTIPDSTVIVNIGQLNASSITGFSKPNVTAIPFTANSPTVDLTLGLGLRFELGLVVDILDGSGRMSADVFLDAPALTVSISQLAGANANCEPVNGSTTTSGFLSNIFPNLTHITAEIGVDTGLEVDASLNVPALNIHTTIGTQTTLFATSAALPTTCLLWNSAQSAFASPTVSTSVMSGAPNATGTGRLSASGGPGNTGDRSNLGGRSAVNPVMGGNLFTYAGGMLLAVFLTAIWL